jgi:hypothetical protein
MELDDTSKQSEQWKKKKMMMRERERERERERDGERGGTELER